MTDRENSIQIGIIIIVIIIAVKQLFIYKQTKEMLPRFNENLATMILCKRDFASVPGFIWRDDWM